MTSDPCPPSDPEQDDSASLPAPQRVVEVAIPNVGTFVIQSKEGGYDDEVEFLDAQTPRVFGHEFMCSPETPSIPLTTRSDMPNPFQNNIICKLLPKAPTLLTVLCFLSRLDFEIITSSKI